MIVTTVHFKIVPGRRDEFLEAIRDNHLGTVCEPGNLRFDVLCQADDPDRYMIYEVFESEEALQHHWQTPHFLRWRERAGDFMAEPRQAVRYSVVEPADRSRW